MPFESFARREYVEAFREIVGRISESLKGLPKKTLPVHMYVAGGAALHFYTGERVTQDVDASFSKRIALPEKLDVSYRDADGAAQLLYLDRQYSDSLALMHDDAYKDSEPLALPGLDPEVLDVRLLTPTDLAVSKIGRLTSQDRDDIAALARHGLVQADSLRQRAEEAVGGFVGDTTRLRGNIETTCRIVADVEARGGKTIGSIVLPVMLAMLVSLVACTTVDERSTRERDSVARRATGICSLPPAEREAELERLKKESGLVVVCGN